MPKPVIAIFDVGKTNKKVFLIDEDYNIVYERSARFTETVDEDGEVCENLEALKSSVFDSLRQALLIQDYDIKAINFSSYGASLVYLDENGQPLTPLYNYLKPYPEWLKKQFYDTYGGEAEMAIQTSSPILGSLNSGLQFYRLKYSSPSVFQKVKWALHLPQYLSFLLTNKALTDITSIGCHTHLWDFTNQNYHHWVHQEGLVDKLGILFPADKCIEVAFEGKSYQVGIGLHDSSAALIPYLENFEMPFILLSTGTWCIGLNPFNNSELTESEINQDCLCYMQYKGTPVKASRLFLGYEHDQQVEKIAAHFNQSAYLFKQFKFNSAIVLKLLDAVEDNRSEAVEFSPVSAFSGRNLEWFATPEEAYHQLILDLVRQQVYSLKLISSDTIKRIFVDGGFSKNEIYMHLLAYALPKFEVFSSSVAQATAIGTALAIHKVWNRNPVPRNIIRLKYYSSKKEVN